MKESREEYKSKTTKEFVEKLNVDMDKYYSVEDINKMLDKHKLKGGFLKFEPTKPHTGKMIIDTLVHMNMMIADGVNKTIGLYEK